MPVPPATSITFPPAIVTGRAVPPIAPFNRCLSDASTEPGSDMEIEDISSEIMELVVAVRQLIAELRQYTCIRNELQSNESSD